MLLYKEKIEAKALHNEQQTTQLPQCIPNIKEQKCVLSEDYPYVLNYKRMVCIVYKRVSLLK